MPLPGWERALEITRAALDRKAYDLVVLEVGGLTSIADGIEDHLGRHGVKPLSVEGRERSQWVLMDYADVVVHVFHVPVREFYDLERLWTRAPHVELPEPFQTLARSQKTGTENR